MHVGLAMTEIASGEVTRAVRVHSEQFVRSTLFDDASGDTPQLRSKMPLTGTNATRAYCGLGCEESEEATIVTKKPQWNHQCSMFYTYNLERRRKDWYLWRKEVCINTTITFEISCGTDRDSRLFYFKNEHLFEYEDAE
ncbi:hypothetical protein TELCIR_06889 [Teladorsagia circumcincta]|uniref:DUF7808 domain-containing protein n=1 Tax=Teladorsagia circumcincta TaxID=45464 RepID=A0A2G9UM33_TELCI|nr:hypothetical protein TELCIR_06889 [Teladorsagia circumcincta]